MKLTRKGKVLIWFAKWFAILAHGSINHKRTWTNVPYWHHLQEVSDLVRSVDGSAEMIAAAWLHDVVEDTWATMWMVRLLFGYKVGLYVNGMTEKKHKGNRSTRKMQERIRLGRCCSKVQTIKLADLVSNGRWIFSNYRNVVKTSRLKRRHRRFDVIYYNEAKLLLEHLGLGDLSLNCILKQELTQFEEFLKELDSAA